MNLDERLNWIAGGHGGVTDAEWLGEYFEKFEARRQKDAEAFHEIQDTLVEQRNEAREWAVRCYRRMRWVEGERDKLQTERDMAREQRDKLGPTLDATRIAMWRAERNTEELQTQVDKLQAQLDAQKALVELLKRAEAHWKSELDELQAERESWGRVAGEWTERFFDMRSKRDKLQAELKELKAELSKEGHVLSFENLVIRTFKLRRERDELQEELQARDKQRCKTCGLATNCAARTRAGVKIRQRNEGSFYCSCDEWESREVKDGLDETVT